MKNPKDEIIEKLCSAKELLEEALNESVKHDLPCDDIDKAVNRVFEACVLLESEEETVKRIVISVESSSIEKIAQIQKLEEFPALNEYFPCFVENLKELLIDTRELCSKFLKSFP